MAARRILGAPLAVLGALSLACAGERSAAPPLTSPSFSLQPAASPFYEAHNLESDGAVPAELVDAGLVSGWGLVAISTLPVWVADNRADRSTPYNANTRAKVSLTFSFP